jgi:ABC-2 type transport system ATP-binding protein
MLRVRGLRKDFGPVRAVRSVSFTLERGRIAVLLGENGAGKTTTLKAILGFLRRDAGTVEMGAGRVGYVPDHPAFFPWLTGRALLDLTARAAGATEPAWSETVRALSEKLLFDTALLGRRPAAYSAGNAKKFAALQSLAVKPGLLVADEPFSALDPPSIKRMRDLLAEARSRGTAVLLSSHMLSEAARVSDEAIVLRRGEVVARFELGSPPAFPAAAPSRDLESTLLSLIAG